MQNYIDINLKIYYSLSINIFFRRINMKIKKVLSKLLCATVIATMCFAAVACSSSNSSSTQVKVPADGYQLPYEYDDGYKAKLKTTDDTTYLVTSTDLIGNKIVHFKTEKSEDEVRKYYDDYFATLEEVKLKNEKDKTPAILIRIKDLLCTTL